MMLTLIFIPILMLMFTLVTRLDRLSELLELRQMRKARRGIDVVKLSSGDGKKRRRRNAEETLEERVGCALVWVPDLTRLWVRERERGEGPPRARAARSRTSEYHRVLSTLALTRDTDTFPL